MTNYSYKGKTALITGASTGIGAAFARELAARGMNVALVARSEDKLRSLADELVQKHGIRAEVLAADLSQPGVAANLYRETQRRNLVVDLLVNNAGFSTFGSFENIDASKEQAQIAVNVATLVDMTHAFIPAMLTRGEGAVINVASIAGLIPCPRQAVYGATKAFVISFSEALYAEVRQRGVRVFTLCPGTTATEFFEEINIEKPRNAQTPQQVVNGGLRAFEQGNHLFISGATNKTIPFLLRLLPRTAVINLTDRASKNIMKPRTAPATE